MDFESPSSSFQLHSIHDETIPPTLVNKFGKREGSTPRKLNKEKIFMKLKNFLRPLIEYYAVLAVVEPIMIEDRHVQLKMPLAIHV